MLTRINKQRGITMNESKCIICGTEVPEGRQVCSNCEIKNTKPSEIEILKEALRLALSDKTYCCNCDLNESCGSEKCVKFRMNEVLKEAKQNLEEEKK